MPVTLKIAAESGGIPPGDQDAQECLSDHDYPFGVANNEYAKELVARSLMLKDLF